MRRKIPSNGSCYKNKFKWKDRDRRRVWSYFGVDGQKRSLGMWHLSWEKEGMEEPRQRIWGWKKPRGKNPKARKKLDTRQENYQGHSGRKWRKVVDGRNQNRIREKEEHSPQIFKPLMWYRTENFMWRLIVVTKQVQEDWQDNREHKNSSSNSKKHSIRGLSS